MSLMKSGLNEMNIILDVMPCSIIMNCIFCTIAMYRYVLSPSALRTALENHPKASCMIFCNPSNPTGTTYCALFLSQST